MKNLYRSHFYTDTYTSSNMYNDNFNNVDVCLLFNQIMPKSFDVPIFILSDRYDSYFLTFAITFKFILKNNTLCFDKFRFSISGSDTQCDSHEDFQQLPLNIHFKDFIRNKYIEFVTHFHHVVSDNITYNIKPDDCLSIQQGISFIDTIFPNEKDIVIIDEPHADFYQALDSGFKDGIMLYEKSRIFLAFEHLDSKLQHKNTIPLKHKKI